MSVADGMRKMLALGISMDEALAIVEAFEIPVTDARKERNKRYYQAHKPVLKRLNSDAGDAPASRLKASEKRLNSDGVPHARVEDKSLLTEIEPQQESKGRKKDASDVFETRFWPAYPNKVGKADAFKAFDRAIKRIDLETMMAGLDLYAHKTDDRPWCNPATWLNQDRWADQPARASPRASPRPATGLNAITEKFRQELAEDGYSNQGQEGRDPQADARLSLLAISDHRGGR